MSHHPRIEEVSDSDPDEMDVDDFLPQNTIMRPAAAPQPQPRTASSSLPRGGDTPLQPISRNTPIPAQQAHQQEQVKTWQSLYPVYFDSSRTRAQGRRVNKELAVENPLAREICDAVAGLGLSVALDASKTHPKDWANPGRVKVELKDGDNDSVKNKHHLYTLVGQYLQDHPATEQTPLRLPIQGLPTKVPPPPAVPRGWKVNSILPLHSPAVSGGGVSENMLKEMMQNMQGEEGLGGMPGMGLPGPSSESQEPKKTKKDKRKNKG